ncbi:MAG TPA: hypothetical protein VGO62_20180, partial [Myxococcota bacterium]
LLAMMNAAYQGQNTDRFEFGQSLTLGTAFALGDQTIPDDVKGDPTRYTELSDPITGQKWFSLNQDRGDAQSPLYSIGYQFLREIKDRYYVGGADGPGTTLLDGFQGSSEFNLTQDLDIARIMSTTAGVFGYAGISSGDVQF